MNYASGSENELRLLASAYRRLEFLEERERLEGSLIEFYKQAWEVVDPAPYQHNWHLDAIAEHLEAVSYGQIRKLCVNLPPRHSKTMLVSVAWNAWLWAQEPDERYPLLGPGSRLLCLSYGDTLAMDNAILARRLVDSEWYQSRWGSRVEITNDQGNKHKFDTTAGGTRISGSFQGTVTGRGGSIRIYDDPHKMDEVESDVIREKVLKIYDTTLKSRITDPRTSAEVLVAQRGHQHDLSSKFLEDGDVVHLNLPAEYDSSRHCVTVLGWEDPRTRDGELLWPERFGPKELAPFKKNTFEWSAQWQQMPVPRGGGLFKEHWWQVHQVVRRKTGGFEFVPGFAPQFVVAALDTAFTEKEENDYSALTVWTVYDDVRTKKRCIILVDAWQKRLEMHGDLVERRPEEIPEHDASDAIKARAEAIYLRRAQPKWGLVEWVAHTCQRRKVDRLIIENKARGHDVNKELRRVFGSLGYGVQMVEPQRSKWARANSVVDLFADEMIYAPAEVDPETGDVRFLEWADMVIRECSAFPHGTHDDIVDTVSMALMHLRSINLAIRRDEQAMEAEELARHRGKASPIYPV